MINFNKKRVVAIIALFVALFMVLTGCSSNQQPTTIDGTYITSGEPHFTAVIDQGNMEVTLEMEGTAGLYWKGTVPKNAEGSFESVADKKALAGSMFGSGSDVKSFDVSDDSIKFVFEIMGTKTDVEAKK